MHPQQRVEVGQAPRLLCAFQLSRIIFAYITAFELDFPLWWSADIAENRRYSYRLIICLSIHLGGLTRTKCSTQDSPTSYSSR